MPTVMTNNQLQVVIDKTARYASLAFGDKAFNDAANAGMELAADTVWSGTNSLANYLIANALDEDILADLMPAARDLDQSHPTWPDSFLAKIPEVAALIKGLNAHYIRNGYKGVDDYLTQANAVTPTLRAHGFYRKYLGTIAASNSFIPADLDLGSCAITGSSTRTFTHLTKIDKTKYGGAKLVAKNVGALNSAPVISVFGVKYDGTLGTLTATLGTATDAHETDLSSVLKVFVDVTDVTITSGGTSGDAFKIVAKTDRDISAA